MDLNNINTILTGVESIAAVVSAIVAVISAVRAHKYASIAKNLIYNETLRLHVMHICNKAKFKITTSQMTSLKYKKSQ